MAEESVKDISDSEISNLNDVSESDSLGPNSSLLSSLKVSYAGQISRNEMENGIR